MGPDPLHSQKIPRLILERLGVYVCVGRRGWGVPNTGLFTLGTCMSCGKKRMGVLGGGGQNGLLQVPKVHVYFAFLLISLIIQK